MPTECYADLQLVHWRSPHGLPCDIRRMKRDCGVFCGPLRKTGSGNFIDRTLAYAVSAGACTSTHKGTHDQITR